MLNLKPKDGLYHCVLGFPQGNPLPTSGWLTLEYSRHAKHASLTDRYGYIKLPTRVAFKACKTVELEYQANQLVKLVIRVPYSEELDLVLAVKPNGFVKTVWLNLVNDTHGTLDKTRYRKP